VSDMGLRRQRSRSNHELQCAEGSARLLSEMRSNVTALLVTAVTARSLSAICLLRSFSIVLGRTDEAKALRERYGVTEAEKPKAS
jgi:hypothetical protein